MIACIGSCILVAVLLLAVYKSLDWFARRLRLPGSYGNRSVLVTGCDSGIGFETALYLVSRGCRVYATCLGDEGEKALKDRCGNDDRLMTLRLDVTDQRSIDHAFDYVSSSLPPGRGLWGLVNNAGVGCPSLGPCEWLTLDDYKVCMDVNFLGVVAVTSKFLPLVKRERGRIVNMSSLLGRAAVFVTSAPYTASKYALESYSDVLRRTLVWYGVTVHIVEPSVSHCIVSYQGTLDTQSMAAGSN